MRYKNPSRYLTKTHSGFTLIELLVVIGIAAIMMTIAVPSFAQMVAQQRVKAAANDFKSAVALARSEARKTGLNTNIRQIGKTSKTDGSWETMSDGWHVYYMGGEGPITLATHQLGSGSVQVAGANSDGFYLLGKTGALNKQYGAEKTICFEDSNDNNYIPAYTVTVNQAGSAVVTKSISCPV